MSLLEISLFAAACINIVLGFYAVYVRPRRITSYALFLFAVGLGIWVGSFFFLLATNNFFFDKINHYAGLLFIGGLFLLALTFPDKRFRLPYLIAYLPFLVGIAFVARGGVVLSDTFGPGDTVTPIQGPLFPYYAAGLLAYLIASLVLFVRTYRTLKGVERLRMKYLFLGIAVLVIPVCVFDIALPAVGFTYLNLIGPFASVGFVVATCYAVMRHQLMDIRVVIQRGTIYSLLIFLIIGAYIGLLLFTNDLFDASMRVAAPLSAGVVIFVSIITIPRIDRYFRRVTDRFFFKDHYDYAMALEELSEILNTNIQLAELAPRLIYVLTTTLKPTDLEFIHLATGATFTSAADNITVSESAGAVAKDGMRIVISAEGRTIGLFTFGKKRSGDAYTEEDRRLLRTFASHAAVAFEKAELYERLEVYSRSLEEKVVERTKSIVELQQQQRELFDDISHALQTPLTVLKGTMELLKAATHWRPQERRPMESMEHSIDDLSRYTRDLLELARIDAMPAEEEFASVDLSMVVANVIEYVEVTCQQSEIRIVKNIQPNATVHGNEKQIGEMIVNLLSNAVRYTAICPTRLITISLEKLDENIEMSITDTGIGISKENLPNIFNRFYRAHDRGASAPGHGLGLAIVKRIVDRHGATIRAESELTKGTSFIVQFPVPQESVARQ